MKSKLLKGVLALLSALSLVGLVSEPSGSFYVWMLWEAGCMAVLALSSRALVRLLGKEGNERC